MIIQENSLRDKFKTGDQDKTAINAFFILHMAIIPRVSNSSSQCFPSRKTIRIDIEKKLSLPSIDSALAYLAKQGIITIEKRKNKNGGDTSNLYTINTDLIKTVGNLKSKGQEVDEESDEEEVSNLTPPINSIDTPSQPSLHPLSTPLTPPVNPVYTNLQDTVNLQVPFNSSLYSLNQENFDFGVNDKRKNKEQNQSTEILSNTISKTQNISKDNNLVEKFPQLPYLEQLEAIEQACHSSCLEFKDISSELNEIDIKAIIGESNNFWKDYDKNSNPFKPFKIMNKIKDENKRLLRIKATQKEFKTNYNGYKNNKQTFITPSKNDIESIDCGF